MPWRKLFSPRLNSHDKLYTDLDPNRHEIRLLKIEPSSSHNEPIKCRLIKASLDDNPQYAALSYVWGDPAITTAITVNGIERAVTISLAAALEEIRKRGELPKSQKWHRRRLVYLWADAISINQKDEVEKSSQIEIMRRIYAQANIVISWLSESWPVFEHQATIHDISLAWKVFVTLRSEHYKEMLNGRIEGDPKSLGIDWLEYSPIMEGQTLNPRFVATEVWDSVWCFCYHPSFQRMWILQEMALAKKHVFWSTYGADIEAEAVWFFVTWMSNLKRPEVRPMWCPQDLWFTLFDTMQATPLHVCSSFRGNMQPGDPQDDNPTEKFYNLVYNTAGHKTTDPRDKIFALRAIPGSMPVDVRKSVREVYCEFQKRYSSLLKENLRFLQDAGMGFSLPNPHELPSWTPDLSGSFKVTWPEGIYRADWGISRNTASFTADQQLNVTGCACDVVTKVEPAFTVGSESLLGFMKDYGWCGQDSQKLYPTGISRKQALIRTLFLDYKEGDSTQLNLNSPTAQLQFVMAIESAVGGAFPEDREMEMSTTESFARAVGITSDTPINSLLQDLLPSGSEIWNLWKLRDETFGAILQYRQRVPDPCWVIQPKDPYLRLFHTANGYLGIGPIDVKEGDTVCIMGGFRMPVLLRDKQSGHVHLGACFVLGFMYGEFQDLIMSGVLRVREFSIH